MLLSIILFSLHTRYLSIPYAYISIESTDCILLSSFEITAILLISSVKKICFSLLNLCCVVNIILLYFVNSLRLSASVSLFSK